MDHRYIKFDNEYLLYSAAISKFCAEIERGKMDKPYEVLHV